MHCLCCCFELKWMGSELRSFFVFIIACWLVVSIIQTFLPLLCLIQIDKVIVYLIICQYSVIQLGWSEVMYQEKLDKETHYDHKVERIVSCYHMILSHKTFCLNIFNLKIPLFHVDDLEFCFGIPGFYILFTSELYWVLPILYVPSTTMAKLELGIKF